MLSFNLKNSIQNSVMSVIEHSEKNGQPQLIATSFKMKNDELQLDTSFTSETISELSSLTIQKTGVHLAITNKHVLTKTVETIDNDQEILSQAYPNLNLGAFYYEILKTSDKAFITLCRKKYVNDLIAQYQANKIMISQVSLGGLNLRTLPSYIDVNPVRSFTLLASFDEARELQSLKNTTDNKYIDYTIDDNTVSSQNVLALATVLRKFSSTPLSGNIQVRNLELHKLHNKAKLYKRIVYGGVGTLLLLLFINFMVFNAGYKKQQELLTALETYKDQTKDLKEYKALIASKEAIVTSMIASGFSKSSFYINQILEDLPTSITLTSLNYQPVSRNINAQKPIRIEQNLIKIEGNSIDKQDFSDWLTSMDQHFFTEYVTILSYGQVKNNRSDFEITISLHKNDSTK